MAIGTDDELSRHLRDEWRTYIENLQHLPAIRIQRWINTSHANKSVQIHGFCDASSLAYGASLYGRTVDENDNVHVHLIVSKSKVAPKKTLTIPRLELCGAHLLSKLLVSIRPSLRHVSVQVDDIRLWTDSEIVIYWLRCDVCHIARPYQRFLYVRTADTHHSTMQAIHLELSNIIASHFWPIFRR